MRDVHCLDICVAIALCISVCECRISQPWKSTTLAFCNLQICISAANCGCIILCYEVRKVFFRVMWLGRDFEVADS